jgi:NAD(P)-dependent dehydrogenase (short-subunit alcohol dehydrogenase family)
MDLHLERKIVLITGGSKGIGLASYVTGANLSMDGGLASTVV